MNFSDSVFGPKPTAEERALRDLSQSKALVVDGNHISRSILVSQMRDFGVGTVVQASRLEDARRQLEYRQFDVVLCEHHFPGSKVTGQDLLDDLRRSHLLPFSTVFIMVTAEATYAKVAEAAESALDGYLLKPHKAGHLGDRLYQARARKLSLKKIFEAIEAEEYAQAAALCKERFTTRGPFWLYAARIGAELMLRVGDIDQAQAMFEEVVAAKTLPWAKLGIARAQLEDRQVLGAISTLENLIGEDPRYTDAYDVLGRAQFELGRFDKARDTYRMASELTPYSINRLQNLALVTFYAGEPAEAEALLHRSVLLGIDSKMFDLQSLVLLAFARLELGDNKGLTRCAEDFRHLQEKYEDNRRYFRLRAIVDCLALIRDAQYAQAVEAVRALAKLVRAPEFDFESAANMLGLLSQLSLRAIQLNEVDGVVDTIGMRFASSRAHAELLAGACGKHAAYAERIRACQVQVLRLTESAMAQCVAGHPRAAVESLVQSGTALSNAKMMETAHLVLQRYRGQITDASALHEAVDKFRHEFGNTHEAKGTLGDDGRPAGGVSLPSVGRKVAPSPGVASPEAA